MRTEPATRGYQRNVAPFDNHRRRLHVDFSSAGEVHTRGVVVRLPLPARSRASRTDAQTLSSDSEGDRLTPIDSVVAFLLFLSTLTGPALAWMLLSF